MGNSTPTSIARTNQAGSLSSTEEKSGPAVELGYFKLAVALSHDVYSTDMHRC